MTAHWLRERSIRTWAWLGDAVFEQDVRTRIASRGDFSLARLDAVKAEVVRAEAQARLLAVIRPALEPNELAICRRARNTAPPTSARVRCRVGTYRDATALEALVAHWWDDGTEGRGRFDQLLVPPLEAEIDAALTRYATKPKRG